MSYHNDPYRVDYLKIYPCLKERPDVLEVLKKSDRKMKYMEVDLKSEQRRKNAENGAESYVPSKEDSLERLVYSAKCQFADDAEGVEDAVIKKDDLCRLRAALDRLCGTPPSERVEQSVTGLLNGLANYPERIQHQRSPAPATHSKTQEALDNALEQQPIDEDNAKTLILRLAAEQYAALGNEEYETNRLRRLFSAFECVAELNADLLKSTVSEVLVTRQNVKLRLKNGQVIERSDLQ